MRVYLSGGMEYAPNEGRSWREDLEPGSNRRWDATDFNPNRESDRCLATRTPEWTSGLSRRRIPHGF